MRFNEVKNILIESEGYRDIKKSIEKETYPIGIYGVSDSARAYLIACLFQREDKNIFIFADSDLNARAIYEDLLLYEERVYFLPGKEVVFYNADAISGDLRWERLRVIKELLKDEKKIIVSSVDLLASKYMPLSYYRDYSFSFKKGDIVNFSVLAKKLIEMGYERCELTENKGQFSLRGGILDLYSPTEDFPIRIELFGDEIDTLRTFNPESQRSLDSIEKVDIFPAREIIIDKKSLIRGRNLILKDLEDITNDKSFRKVLGEEGFNKLKTIVKGNVESLEESWSFETVDSYLEYFFEKSESFFDYMDDSFVFLDSTDRSLGRIKSLLDEFSQKYTTFLQRGDIMPRQGEILLKEDEILGEIKGLKLFTINEFIKSERDIAPKSIVKLDFRSIYNFRGQLDMMIEDIKLRKEKGYSIIILSGTKSRGERLLDTLKDRGIEAIYRERPNKLESGLIVISYGSQLKGFESPELKFSLFSDAEVFGEGGKDKKKGRRRVTGKGIEKIRSFDDLRKGEYVVHVNHGIGIYKGIRQINSLGATKDYLEIAYDSNDKLFIPVDQLDLLSKYIGNEGSSPKVSRLSTAEWGKLKVKAKESIDKIAKEIVELYAKRSTIKGFAFSKDTDWQRAFEEDFPFEETKDQLLSIDEIKKDMEATRVMDRLLCGDVGYGKTEVAMRAAFKAVMDGKQVAVLVPTTILAEQHYKNFKRRFEDYSVNVDMVSRFRTAKNVKETLDKLRQGNVDIVIGTHKLLGKETKFYDLGLLIIDEEQRFGVKHKEKLKELKTSVDVLTLSATPIPRTLNMSMTGVRDISLIESPPEDRFPIQTYVLEQNDQLIRDAILREMGRKGQVYFVYNKVSEIDNMATYLKKLIPEAEFGVAHGQLSERELENRMLAFMDGQYDVLVCSTIIETGLDIQNVNTIIVADADKMGLSQLYQLRGRVGRTNRLAYAYLTYRKDKVLTEVAEKRLKALKDFTDLGSGFKIAMKDLEIRGAGNMMGKAQHGHMAAIGYDLYIRMLDEAVKKLTGKIENERIDTTIDIKINAYIPSSYIKDEVIKIQIYKKIAAIENRDDFMEVKEELEDRFSKIPEEVYNLMEIAELKSLASGLGILEVKDLGERVNLIFKDNRAITDGMVDVFINDYKKLVKIEKSKANEERVLISFNYKGGKRELIRELKQFFKLLIKRR